MTLVSAAVRDGSRPVDGKPPLSVIAPVLASRRVAGPRAYFRAVYFYTVKVRGVVYKTRRWLRPDGRPDKSCDDNTAGRGASRLQRGRREPRCRRRFTPVFFFFLPRPSVTALRYVRRSPRRISSPETGNHYSVH